MQNPMIAALDNRVDGLYRLVKGRVNWDNLVPTCLEVAQELEQMSELKGPQKLELLQKTLRFALRESDLPKDKKESISYVIGTVVPIVMQAAIMASKLPIVNKLQTTSCCMPSLRSK
jgi:hypothetical protein